MALVVKDRVKETTSTTGTGTLTLAGAVAKFQSFSVVGDGNTTYYAIESGNGTDWEVGVGTYTASGTTLSRDTILESSNGGTAISLTGTSTVFCTYPAERSVNTADIGTTIQAYDADTAKYDDTTANFTGTLQNGGSNVVVDTDIGSTVQAYDADTTKNDVANTFTANQTINGDLTVDTDTLYVDSTNNRVGIGTSSPSSGVKTHIYTTTATNAPTLKIEQSSTSYNAGVGMFNGNSTNGFNILVDGNGGAQIRQNDNNYMVFATNNAERMRIDSSGNVGIGTSSPSSVSGYTTLTINNGSGAGLIDLQSAGTSRGRLFTSGANAYFYNPTANALILGTSDTERMHITSAGNITVKKYNGTAASPTESADWPTPVLNLRGYGNFTQESMLSFGYSNDAEYQTGNNVWGFRLNGTASATTSSSSTHLNLVGPGNFYLYSNGDAIFAPGNVERMRIVSGGNVGIGTSSPGTKLHVEGNGSSEYIWLNNSSASAYSARLKLSNTSDTNSNGFQIINNGGDGVVNLLNYKNTPLAFWTNNAERMRITDGGSLCIGTTSTGSILDVIGGVQTIHIGTSKTNNTDKYGSISHVQYANSTEPEGFSLIGGYGQSGNNAVVVGGGFSEMNAAATIQFFTASNVTTRVGTERMRIASNGYVGIGTSSPTQQLDVNGTVKATTFSGSGSGLTNLPAPTTSAVLSATAGAAVGAVGTYAWLGYDSTANTTISEGQTIAGSTLRYAGGGIINWNMAQLIHSTSKGGTPSGTWRVMGKCQTQYGDVYPSTIFLRIS